MAHNAIIIEHAYILCITHSCMYIGHHIDTTVLQILYIEQLAIEATKNRNRNVQYLW